jgi:hypothetical protein
VTTAAREVRNYPVEAVARISGIVEQALAGIQQTAHVCEKSAAEAQNMFNEVQKNNSYVNKYIVLVVIVTSIMSSLFVILLPEIITLINKIRH